MPSCCCNFKRALRLILHHLNEEIIAETRHAGKKIVLLCSYADKMMTRKEGFRTYCNLSTRRIRNSDRFDRPSSYIL